MEPEVLQPPRPGRFVWFSLICSGGGGWTAAAVTLDTVADQSRKRMANGVARSPSLLCSREGKICCYGDALNTIFLRFLYLASYSSFFFSFLNFFPAFRCVYLRVPSSVQQPPATSTPSTYVFYSTFSFCLCHLGILFLFLFV